MGVIVCKFGGTSLANAALRSKIYDYVEGLLLQKHKVVMIVSAFGRLPDPYATDTLVSYSSYLPPMYVDRMLALGEQFSTLVVSNELYARNLVNVPCNVLDIGIITDEQFNEANILQLHSERLQQYLMSYDVLVVPGFQGLSYHQHITTLGRGGSDLSAIVIACMLQVSEVYCYTDVDGVYEYDPKTSLMASKYTMLSYDKMLQLIDNGAKVMCKNSILWAKQYQIRIFVGKVDALDSGTWIEG